MHGSLFHGFKQYVLGRLGVATWNLAVQTAKGSGWYHASSRYPDEELEALITAVAAAEGKAAGAVWEEFGTALVPHLVTLYGAYLLPHWRTLDLLENVEGVVHRTVRMHDKAAEPPRLRPVRISSNEVRIEYASARRLCRLAVGICRGVAAHFDEEIMLAEPQCMLAGATHCVLVVRHTGGNSDAEAQSVP